MTTTWPPAPLARRELVALSVLALPLLATACSRPSGAARAAPAATPATAPSTAPAGLVSVVYAGSLVNAMEHGIGPAFAKATGLHYEGEGKGSVALVNLIKDHLRTPDVFISADPSVNAGLMGSANGDFLRWYLTMARTELVIAWSPRSRFAADFLKARSGAVPWFRVLQEPGLRFGRTDPRLDPKGYRTIWLFELAEIADHQTGLRAAVLGSDENPDQIFPEEQLVARLEAGQLDAGVFYLNEAVEQQLPYLRLPPAINQGDPSLAATYARVSYTDPRGHTIRGSPIVYTIAALRTAPNPAGALRFVQFVLGPSGQAILHDHGLLSTPVLAGGHASALPPPLRSLVTGSIETGATHG